jgi:hypothetical protein
VWGVVWVVECGGGFVCVSRGDLGLVLDALLLLDAEWGDALRYMSDEDVVGCEGARVALRELVGRLERVREGLGYE